MIIYNKKIFTDKISFLNKASVAARKAILIGVFLAWLNQFCGCFAMLNYTATIFAEAGSNLTPNMSAIIVGIIQLLGAYISTFLVDRAGRKVSFINFTTKEILNVFLCT